MTKHIHILGICGTFMGSLAVLAKQAGFKVTGCDENVYPPMSTQLEAQGIELIQGFGTEQLSLKPDLYVIGNVVKRGTPLMEEILNQGLPYTSGPQWLGEHILQGKWTIAVAGTHGKTTTTSMLAWILEFCGYNPGFLVGGVPQNFGISARLTQSDFFVIEADEYDTAFFDKRSKFVHYRPKTAILNNLEFDHADIFADLTAIETQFHHLVRTIPSIGRVIFNAAQPALNRVLEKGCWSEKEGFSARGDWQIANPKTTPTSDHFDVMFQGETQGRLSWELQGEHNRENALAAIAAARHVGVQAKDAIEALCKFQNVKRRMEVRGVVNQITVYDDFAHHPSAIQTTIAGLRARVGQHRILAVLEPRSNTMKLGVMKTQLAESLQDADAIFCFSNQLGWSPSEALAPLADKTQVFAVLDELVAAVASIAKPGDQVLVMSNGGFGGVHQKILDQLA